MKTISTAFAVLLATIFMTACGKKESAAPAEAAPATTAAPAEEAPPANPDSPATGGDKVAPKANDAPPPPAN